MLLYVTITIYTNVSRSESRPSPSTPHPQSSIWQSPENVPTSKQAELVLNQKFHIKLQTHNVIQKLL
jgi:hypothetical protein